MSQQKHIPNIPSLRFLEFEKDWKTKRIGDLGTFLGGGTPESSNKNYWQGEVPWISSSDISDGSIHRIVKSRFITNEAIIKSATKIIPKGSVLMVSRVGIGKFAVADEPLCTSQDFTNLVTNEDSYFLGYYFVAKAIRFVRLSQGTSIKGFTGNDIKNAKFAIPSFPEQQKIASFLTAVDTKIEQLTKKKTLLEQYKKGMMQKIFNREIRFKPANGENYPNWEEYTLGQLLDYEQPTNYLVSSTEYDDSFNTPVLTAGKTFLLGYTNEKEGIFSKGLPVIIFDDFTTATQFVDFPFKAKSSAMKILKAKSGSNIRFVYEIMQTIKFEIGGHGRHWISQYSNLYVSVPSTEEQTQIANFLSAIDDKIGLVSTQLENTQKFKKGLLQQMFV